MRGLGQLFLAIAIAIGLYALSMDVTAGIDGSEGRVLDISRIADKQNYLLIAGVGFIGGLLMIIFGRNKAASIATPTGVSGATDPFDELQLDDLNERKRHAISLGVKRKNGIYFFNGVAHHDLESAIVVAETVKSTG